MNLTVHVQGTLVLGAGTITGSGNNTGQVLIEMLLITAC